MTLAQPAQLGKTARFEVHYPSSAAGNPGWFAVSSHFAGALPLSLPGLTTFGEVRVDLQNLFARVPWQASGPGAGSASLEVPIAPATSMIGLAFDVQTLDLDVVGLNLYWSDNDIEAVVAAAGCGNSAAVQPLHPLGSVQEPDTQQDTPAALITYLSDRARDRHAREAQFQAYDHWLPFYWEQRIAEITILDAVAKGGATVTFRFVTHDALNPAEFRAFHTGSAAVYHHNLSNGPGTGVTLISTQPSTRYPGETEYCYEAVLTTAFPAQQPLQVGDKIEVELSQFLANPRNGRHNYYGTALLYVVGEGVVPWYAKEIEEGTGASQDSYRLPDHAWLGGETTLPYQYSNEPTHRFKQLAGNITHASGHEFVLGRRLHHTNFDTGEHSEPGNPPMSQHTNQLGDHFIAGSCVDCHINNGRSLPVSVGNALRGAVVRLAGDQDGSTPHPTLGDTLQPSILGPGSGNPGGGLVDVTLETECYAAASGVTTQRTSDVGGGLNVTSIDSGDWMSFHTQPINIPTAGTYRVSFRVAAASAGGRLAFEQSGGAVIYGVVDIPDTGGMQVWQTVSQDMDLTAGSLAVGLNANIGGFNCNWFRVESLPAGGVSSAEGQAVLDSYTFTNGTYGDGTPYQLRRPNYTFTSATPAYFSVRHAQPLVGLGLLEAIDEATIFARHDPCDDDLDGISCRVSVTLGLATGQDLLGRFGWKGTRASVRDQLARALNRDMGVVTSLQAVLDGESSPSAVEVTDLELDRMTRYVSLRGGGARRDLTDPSVLQGECLFQTIGCADCHVPEMQTGDTHPFGELRNQTIRPFTDLLLHDMGPGLADSMGDGDATATEWRTAPLWNIGLTDEVVGAEAYLHDGRARTLEEAILWHGGEGEAAREAFRMLPTGHRNALIAFLRSL